MKLTLHSYNSLSSLQMKNERKHNSRIVQTLSSSGTVSHKQDCNGDKHRCFQLRHQLNRLQAAGPHILTAATMEIPTFVTLSLSLST
jgi:hypothetical protein